MEFDEPYESTEYQSRFEQHEPRRAHERRGTRCRVLAAMFAAVALVSEIIPELAGSAFGNATVRQVMDMTTGLAYSEDYSDPKADMVIVRFAPFPTAKNAKIDPISLPAYQAVADYLLERD